MSTYPERCARPGPAGLLTQTVHSRGLLLLALGLLLLAAVLAFTTAWPATIEMTAAGVLALPLTSARATVDGRGLTIVLGPLGFPHIRIPVTDIAAAKASKAVPRGFGGWGYRIVPGGRAVIIRSGPALVVTRRNAPRFTITIDDPETAAQLLTKLSADPT